MLGVVPVSQALGKKRQEDPGSLASQPRARFSDRHCLKKNKAKGLERWLCWGLLAVWVETPAPGSGGRVGWEENDGHSFLASTGTRGVIHNVI